ncbi:hypothetical protein Tco_0459771, partial [Tanacetum coccineum]
LIVISSDDDDLSTDEDIMLMGDIPFSTSDDEYDDDHRFGCGIFKHTKEVKEMKSSEVGNAVEECLF